MEMIKDSFWLIPVLLTAAVSAFAAFRWLCILGFRALRSWKNNHSPEFLRQTLSALEQKNHHLSMAMTTDFPLSKPSSAERTMEKLVQQISGILQELEKTRGAQHSVIELQEVLENFRSQGWPYPEPDWDEKVAYQKILKRLEKG